MLLTEVDAARVRRSVEAAVIPRRFIILLNEGDGPASIAASST